jgi:broad specificity phosphatase PhoE
MQILRAEMGLEAANFHTDDRLKEINYGSWEGLAWDEISALNAAGHQARQADLWNWQPRGGESCRVLAQRVAAWLAEIADDTVVVAHRGRHLRPHLGAVCTGGHAPRSATTPDPGDRGRQRALAQG